MKTKLIGLTLAASVALVGCNTNNDHEEGMRNNDRNPVEQTRYNEDMNDLDEGVRQKDDKNTYDRDQVDTNDRADNDNQRDRTDDHRKTDDKNNEDRYAVSKDAANRITDELKEIDGAYVITTNNNAYVAAKLDKDHDGKSGKELTDDSKKKIKKIVKDTETDIDHVYVTTNPDFTNLLNKYADDVDNDKPIGGFFDQIGNMIERVFPQDKS